MPTFAQLTANNLSYFLSVNASRANPASRLVGDRNLCMYGWPTNGFVEITNWSAVTWGADIHKHQGNIGLADGSAHQTTDLILQRALQASGIATNHFAIP